MVNNSSSMVDFHQLELIFTIHILFFCITSIQFIMTIKRIFVILTYELYKLFIRFLVAN